MKKVVFLSSNKNLHYPAKNGVSHYFKAGELVLDEELHKEAVDDLRLSIKKGNGGVFWEAAAGATVETAPVATPAHSTHPSHATIQKGTANTGTPNPVSPSGPKPV